jgi:plasmid stability protein
MPTFTIKKFPDPLLKKLRERAVAARRSMTQEVLARLEASLIPDSPSPQTSLSYSEAGHQADTWAALAGKWASDLTVKDEIEQLYKARTRGRKVTL